MTNYRRPAGSSGAQRTRCPRCHRPVLRQLVGQRAALDVVADDERMSLDAAVQLREPDRLDWCLRIAGGGFDLRWSGTGHPAGCKRPHVLDHQCTAPADSAARTAPRRTRKQPPVSAGQLTL